MRCEAIDDTLVRTHARRAELELQLQLVATVGTAHHANPQPPLKLCMLPDEVRNIMGIGEEYSTVQYYILSSCALLLLLSVRQPPLHAALHCWSRTSILYF